LEKNYIRDLKEASQVKRHGSAVLRKKRKDRFIRGGLARTGYQNRVIKARKKGLICAEEHRRTQGPLRAETKDRVDRAGYEVRVNKIGWETKERVN